MNNRVYLIIGYPQNGKTEIAEIIAEHFGVPHGSTSDVVYEALAASRALRNSSTLKGELAILRATPKQEIRDELVKMGDHLCASGGASCISWHLISKGCRVIDGVRRVEEFWELRHRLVDEGFKPIAWWIQREPEPPRVVDNTTVTQSDADAIFLNWYPTLDDLRAAVKAILQ